MMILLDSKQAPAIFPEEKACKHHKHANKNQDKHRPFSLSFIYCPTCTKTLLIAKRRHTLLVSCTSVSIIFVSLANNNVSTKTFTAAGSAAMDLAITIGCALLSTEQKVGTYSAYTTPRHAFKTEITHIIL